MLTWKDLEVVRRTTKSYELQFKKSGVTADITGWTIYFTVKKKMEDSDSNAIISKDVTDHSDPTDGKTLISLTIADTNPSIANDLCYYDIKYKDTDGNVGILLRGKIKFIEAVTQRG